MKDVTLTGNAVSGNFKTPLHELQSGTSSTTTYARFSSYVPETGDPTLLLTLEKNGVQVTAQPVQMPWWQTALTILLNALPLLLLVYFGYMAMRNIRQSQQGGDIFGVGRSRAKLYFNQLIAENSWQILGSATSGAAGNSVLLFEQYKRKSKRKSKNLQEKRKIKKMVD